jgi:hypothetical protein
MSIRDITPQQALRISPYALRPGPWYPCRTHPDSTPREQIATTAQSRTHNFGSNPANNRLVIPLGDKYTPRGVEEEEDTSATIPKTVRYQTPTPAIVPEAFVALQQRAAQRVARRPVASDIHTHHQNERGKPNNDSLSTSQREKKRCATRPRI